MPFSNTENTKINNEIPINIKLIFGLFSKIKKLENNAIVNIIIIF